MDLAGVNVRFGSKADIAGANDRSGVGREAEIPYVGKAHRKK
jgi:hypothetical protein